MKTKFIFSVFIVVLYMGKMDAQIMPAIKKTALLEQEKAILNQHINEYTTFTIDKKTLLDSLYKNGNCQFQMYIDEKLNWTLDLQINDMRAPDYKQTYISDKEKFEYKSFMVNTFKGETSNNQVARFTIDENTFFGVILNEHGNDHYIIRSAKDYTKNSLDNNLIIYKSSNIIFKNEKTDYINDALIIPDNDKIANIDRVITKSNTSCPYFLEIATDADYEFYQTKGNDLVKTYNDIFSVLNIVEGVYESTFNMKFIITQQNVWTTTSNGYPYTSTNYSTLLDQFRTYWKSNKTGVIRDLAHLFTGKNLGSTVGVAWRGALGGDYGYALSVFRSQMYQTTAHEIGHNLNATDNPSNCSCGTSDASVMCQGTKDANLWFCQTSINQINPYLVSNSNLLAGTNNLTLTGIVNGYNEYLATQKITSNQIINSGFTIYKAHEVELGNYFEIKSDAVFEIDNNDCR